MRQRTCQCRSSRRLQECRSGPSNGRSHRSSGSALWKRSAQNDSDELVEISCAPHLTLASLFEPSRHGGDLPIRAASQLPTLPHTDTRQRRTSTADPHPSAETPHGAVVCGLGVAIWRLLRP